MVDLGNESSECSHAGRSPAQHVVATAGHVDHGKSTLVRAITGQEPDRWAEEQRRGLTIDLGFVWTDLPTAGTVAFVDVPGHHRFVDNALAGAGAVRDVLLVVAADDGWSAQTQEHVEIADLLGLRGLAIAVTKTVPAGPERTAEVVVDVERRLAGTSLAGAPIVPVDAVDGRGVDEVIAALDRGLATTEAPITHGARLWIDRTFTVKGTGTVVTGTLDGGPVAVGNVLRLHPHDRAVRVRGVQSLGTTLDGVTGPARVALALADVGTDEVARGDVLVAPAEGWIATSVLDVWGHALPGRTLERTGDWLVHVGSARLSAEVLPVIADLSHPDQRHPDATPEGPLRLVLSRRVPLRHGDRLVLRETGRRATMGGATVLDPDPVGELPRNQARATFAERLRDLAHGGDAVEALVRGGARPSVRVAAVLPGSGDTSAATVRGVVLDSDLTASAEAAILGAATTPTAADRLVEKTPAVLPVPARRALVAGLVDDGRLRATPDGLVAADAEPEVADAQADVVIAFLALLDKAGLSPPKLAESAAASGVSRVQVQQLVQQGRVLRAGDLAFHARRVEEAIAILRDLPTPFTAAEAKSAWGTTRRSAIPLLELLDARRVTTFDGTHRTLVG